MNREKSLKGILIYTIEKKTKILYFLKYCDVRDVISKKTLIINAAL